MLGQAVNRSCCSPVALAPCPDLRLANELSQLVEDEGGLGSRAVERRDPLESRQHCSGFFHARDASRTGVSACAQLCNTFATCTQAEQRVVELAQEPRAIAV